MGERERGGGGGRGERKRVREGLRRELRDRAVERFGGRMRETD